jgi:site-specific DNA-methyltransferase (adenine-specific)
MKELPDKSVDMILCDLPYGTTACKWDTIIPFEPLWACYKRIIKDNGAIVLTASQPFTSVLINSNLSDFKYCWVWEKEQGVNFQLVKYQPLKVHEDICVFSSNTHRYFPQGLVPCNKKKSNKFKGGNLGHHSSECLRCEYIQEFKDYPQSILFFKRERGLHPTQKPVALMEYLIKTYTNEGDTVLDNCMGSGTTGVACKRIGRDFIGFEKDPTYFEIAKKRIDEA